MSYEIYYDRAFIRVGERFVPLVNKGSSNCWTMSLHGREIPEKNWQVWNWRQRSQLLFTEDEIRKIAEDYELISQDSGTCFRARNHPFGKGEFKRWILCGLKSPYTIEEYVSFGNGFEIHDYSAKNMDDWKLYPFSTTAEFLNLLDQLKNSRLLNVHILDNRHVCRPHRKKESLKDYRDQKEYFVLCTMQGSQNNREVFFCKLTKHGYLYTDESGYKSVRTFPTDGTAQNYILKHKDRLSGFTIKKMGELNRISKAMCGKGDMGVIE